MRVAPQSSIGPLGVLWVRSDPVVPLLPLIVFAASLIAPVFAYALALVAIFASVDRPRWLLLSWIVFAHVGALIYASRDFTTVSSDFVNYHAAFSDICVPGSTGDGGFAFGAEIGILIVYKALASIGGCHLSIAGLAYVQCLLVSSLLLISVSGVPAFSANHVDRAVSLVGLALLFSFFYVTQLSRQSLSSYFLIHALWVAKTRWRVVAALALATLFHLTAPILFLLAWAFRRFGWRAIVLMIIAAGLFANFAFAPLLSIALQTDVDGVNKFAFYASVDDIGAATSDWASVVILATATLPALMIRPGNTARSVDAWMLLGFAITGACMLGLPLAATRTLLPFAWFAGGLFLLRSLSLLSRSLAGIAVIVLTIARLATLALSPPGGDHALWTTYPAASMVPGYFIPQWIVW